MAPCQRQTLIEDKISSLTSNHFKWSTAFSKLFVIIKSFCELQIYKKQDKNMLDSENLEKRLLIKEKTGLTLEALEQMCQQTEPGCLQGQMIQ